MTKISHFSLKILAGVFFLANAFAGEAPKDSTNPLSKALPYTQSVFLQNSVADDDQLSQNDEQNEERSEIAVEEAALKNLLSDKACFFSSTSNVTTHPGAFYNLNSISFDGSILELNDGSIWKVANDDSYKVYNWLTFDQVVLTINHGFKSGSYPFRFTNQQTLTSVRCSMELPPLLNGINTRWIQWIDYFMQELVLDDGSRWSIAADCSSWLPTQTVMIGVNDSSKKNYYPNFLYNLERNRYVKAICTQL